MEIANRFKSMMIETPIDVTQLLANAEYGKEESDECDSD